MGYYEGEKSLGLGPILLALSLVTVVGFGLLYYMCGRSIEPTGAQDLSQPVQSIQPAQPSTQPVAPAKPHNHV